jgi:non-specific serine/threonine protein kinase
MPTAVDSFNLGLTPHGRLFLELAHDGLPLPSDAGQRLVAAFARGPEHGLLHLGAVEVDTPLPLALAYWRDFARRFVSAVCGQTQTERERQFVPPPKPAELDALVLTAPPMPGAEYLTPGVLESSWGALGTAFEAEFAESKAGSIEEFLRRRNAAWHTVGRVHFNLAVNRLDADAPFAFLATYTATLSTQAKPQHLPLGRALSEYAGAANRPRLLSLLVPVQRAAEQCAWVKAMVDAGDIYEPLRWTAGEAFQLLTDLPRLEAAGVIVRVPSTWRANRPPRPKVSAVVGSGAPAGVGTGALLDFAMEVTLDGERLTRREIDDLLAASDGLHLVRGRWVEVDRSRLRRMLDEFRAVEHAAATHGLDFAAAMRLLAGARLGADPLETEAAEWSRVTAGPWLADTLEALRRPEALARLDPGDELKATLRPYQHAGVRWLHLLSSLGLGACLADDMGLGKTMQVLALLLVRRRQDGRRARRTSLIVAPASLVANWESEARRFAPTLRTLVAHPSVTPPEQIRALHSETVREFDLVVTSYGTIMRSPAFARVEWDLAILDEAQAIKNPGAKQTRAVKRLDANARIALTGTPVENQTGDLWSIFDFINAGLLGTATEFGRYTKRITASPHLGYGPLRALVRPYILRRLKSDRSVIADLPAKTEVKAFCALTRKQAALYEHSVEELRAALQAARGIARKGLVLAFLTRFKQICNHPSQWTGDGAWAEADSGKLARLREIVEVIAARQEKVLVFTQFLEVTEPLAAFLTSVFGRPGLVLHGQTAVKARQALVEQFQEDERVPFFVLSLKAGGTGLTLTAATHVIHFDRWWNPAVEDQATDRAYRIGQARNVLVHTLLCRGTVEEKIDTLVESKRQVSRDLLEGGADTLLTEMSNDDLLRMVALDLRTASQE